MKTTTGIRGLRRRLTAVVLNAVRNMRNTRTYTGMLQAEDFFHGPTLDWEPTGERVVVLAPHMDDEVIGCGGTLVRHLKAGAKVTVVFLTDGRHGGAHLHKLSGQALEDAQKAVIERRKGEAREALGTLGIADIVFLDAEDTALAADKDAPRRLREVLERLNPTLVYLPFFLEHHPDHRAVSPLLIAATEGAKLDFTCHGYEVWTPLFPNCMVWIDESMDLKRQAMQCYRSQLDDANDLLHAMQGLAAYRSVIRSKRQGRFAEAFCAMPLAEYAQAYRAYSTDQPFWAPRGTGRAANLQPHVVAAPHSQTANG